MKFTVTKPSLPKPVSGLGGSCLGHKYTVNDTYITKDGLPYIYKMGELHFSRVPRRDWERELLKMKAGGIDIVSSYLIWIHHEEIEGEFDFTGNNDLHAFCEVCRKVDMPFFLRIGPWAHGEVRNGGFPDWLAPICGGKENMRKNQRPYLDYVERYFSRIYAEVKDMGDVIIGIQVENELRSRPDHLEYLKEYLVSLGFDPPFWSATAWGGDGPSANVPKNGFLPMLGGYPDAPWSSKLCVLEDQDTYFFRDERGSSGIGNDLLGSYATAREDAPQYPYLTCELGGGNQVTYHRRPIISADDITAITVCAIGSGVKGLGYYMYHGGKNPMGKLSTMQESRAVGDTNDYPIFSYDFQSPLGECGQLRESYFRLRSIHEFISACEQSLAPMGLFLPQRRPHSLSDLSTPRMSVLSDGERGFLFVNNHVHAIDMPPVDERVAVSLPDKTVEIDVKLAPGAVGIIPFLFPIGSVTADYVTAMPVSVSDGEVIFEANRGIEPVIRLDDGRVIPLVGSFELGGVTVTLRETALPKPSELIPVKVTKRESRISDEAFGHVVNRDGTPIERVRSAEYELKPPKGASYLIVEAVGNAAVMYRGNEPFDDFYLYGDRWVCDLRAVDEGTPITLKVLPLSEENKKKIYFETDMPCGVREPRVYALLSDDIGYIER